jgi:hypothetical protein
MKKLFISAIFASLMLCFSISAQASLLSPGLSVIQKSVTMEKKGVAKNTVTFSAEDFEEALGMKEIGDIRITSLPLSEQGALMLGEKNVKEGDVIEREMLASLAFVPAQNGASASFGFIPCKSAYKNDFSCLISLTEQKLDLAPTTRSDTISDMAGITVFSVLSAENDDDEKLHFSVVSGASHGTVEIIDVNSGEYRYTPAEGFYGKDSFTFCVTDESGNTSNISTITVNVERNKKNLVYSDMAGDELHLAAAVLLENDIMMGSYDGSARVFKPDGTVTRSDFLIMAMDAAGIAAKSGESGFSDESEFSPYEKKYIATAKSLGITVGIETEKGLCFCADRDISAEEASLISCRISALKGLELVPFDVAVAVMDDDSYNALSILANAGIMENAKADENICRADAAEILYSIFKYTEKE